VGRRDATRWMRHDAVGGVRTPWPAGLLLKQPMVSSRSQVSWDRRSGDSTAMLAVALPLGG
jgi:hypothetical protein